MKIVEKRKPVRGRPAAESKREARATETAGRSSEDERDLKDALRARGEAEREGSYPWEQLKREIEG